MKFVNKYNPVHDIEVSPDIKEYIDKFYCVVSIKEEYSHGSKLIELNSWCYKYLGTKFRDWFLILGGVRKANSKLLIKDPKRATLFFLQYGDAIDATLKLPNTQPVQQTI